NSRAPVGVGWSVGDQLAVALERTDQVAILFPGEREPEARLRPRRFKPSQLLERAPRLFRNDAVLRENRRLPEACQSPWRFPEQPNRPLIGLRCLAETALPQVNRGDHIPPLAVLRMRLQTSLDLRHEPIDRRPLHRS